VVNLTHNGNKECFQFVLQQFFLSNLSSRRSKSSDVPNYPASKFLSFIKKFLPCCSRTSVVNCSVVGPHFKLPIIDAVTRFIKDRSRSSSPCSDCSFINPQPMRSKFYISRCSDKMFYVSQDGFLNNTTVRRG
jgi:hypothetical protein